MESPCARRSAAFSAGVLVLGARLLLATAHHRRCRSWLETNDDVAMHPRRQRDSRLILGKLACGEILEFVTWGLHNVPGGLRANRTLLHRGGRIIVRHYAASGSIMAHSVAAFHCNQQAAQNWKRSCPNVWSAV